MAKNAVLHCVEETCRRVMRNNLPFGGKVVVLLGDFRQTCPVVRNGTRRQVVDASIRSSPLWNEFSTFRLHQPIRHAEDLSYADFVDLIGDGDPFGIRLPLLPSLRWCDVLLLPGDPSLPSSCAASLFLRAEVSAAIIRSLSSSCARRLEISVSFSAIVAIRPPSSLLPAALCDSVMDTREWLDLRA